MMMSVDGRISCEMTEHLAGSESYYGILDSLNVDGLISGKVTALLETTFGNEYHASSELKVGEETFYHHPSKVKRYEIIADSKGILSFDDEQNDGLILLLSEQVKKEYLEYLKKKKISYIVSGKDRVNLKRASEILCSEFGIKRLAVVGGGNINGGFIKEKLIDEVILLIGNGIDGRNKVSVFDGLEDDFPLTYLKLKDIQRIEDDAVLLSYQVMK